MFGRTCLRYTSLKINSSGSSVRSPPFSPISHIKFGAFTSIKAMPTRVELNIHRWCKPSVLYYAKLIHHIDSTFKCSTFIFRKKWNVLCRIKVIACIVDQQRTDGTLGSSPSNRGLSRRGGKAPFFCRKVCRQLSGLLYIE